jgi:hypothetical protein
VLKFTEILGGNVKGQRGLGTMTAPNPKAVVLCIKALDNAGMTQQLLMLSMGI